jgi:hypothetical protein
MIAEINNEILSPDLNQKIKNLETEINEFRQTPLDTIALEKLREHFRTDHVYHSAGIEGNRLTIDNPKKLKMLNLQLACRDWQADTLQLLISLHYNPRKLD